MLKDKVFLTYKRKRLSFQNYFVHDSKETKLPSNTQVGSSWLSSPKSKFDTGNEKVKKHHSGNSQCSTSNTIHDFSECIQKHSPETTLETKRTRQSRIFGQKNTEPMVLHSHKVLNSIKTEDISLQAISATVSNSQIITKDIIQVDVSDRNYELDHMACALESSTSSMAIRDLSIIHDLSAIILNENAAVEGGFTAECPEVIAKMNQHSCKGDNDGLKKSSSSTAPLITFSRRGKTKQDIIERVTDRNFKIVEKQSISATCDSQVIVAEFVSEGSPQKCIFDEQSSSAPILLKSCAATASHANSVTMANSTKVNVMPDLNAEIQADFKIEKILETSSELQIPPLSVIDTSEDPSKDCSAIQQVHNIRDARDCIFPINTTEKLNSNNNAIILCIEESGRKLINGPNNCESRKITHLSEVSPACPELPFCQMNGGADKLSDKAVPENPRDSPSSSTPCCSIVFVDGENEGRKRETDLLENLDNALGEKKIDRDACSFMVQNVEICRGFCSMITDKSAKHSVNDQMVNNSKVNVVPDLNAEIHVEFKIENIQETSSELQMPPLSTMYTSKDISKECSNIQSVHGARDVRDCICMINTKEPLNSVCIKESDSKLINESNNCESRKITHLSENSPAFPELSVFQMNDGADKLSNKAEQSSSTPCCSVVFVDGENEGRSMEIDRLDNLDDALREKKNDRDACSFMVHDVEICRGLNSTITDKSAKHSVNDQIIGIDFMSQLSSFPEKKPWNILPDPSSEMQSKIIKQTLFADFLNRPSPSSFGAQLGLSTEVGAVPLCSHFVDNFSKPDGKLLCSSNVKHSLFQHRHMTENTIAEIMNRLPKRRHSADWSEEELDSLWIGVRRHGVDKWNAVFRDPKLEFAPSRLPEDLALQWDREQKKLFNGSQFPVSRISKPTTFPDTKLSLGEVYQLDENLTKNSQFCTAGYPQTCESSSTFSFLGTFLPMPAIRSKNTSVSSKIMYQINHGLSKQSPAGLSASANIPHWLKEVRVSHSSPSDSPWPALFSAGIIPTLINKNDSGEPHAASKDLRGRGILKKRATKSSGKIAHAAVKIEEVSTSIEESLCGKFPPASVHKNLSTDLSTKICLPIVPNDLVIIGCDASSEETISDNQNMAVAGSHGM